MLIAYKCIGRWVTIKNIVVFVIWNNKRSNRIFCTVYMVCREFFVDFRSKWTTIGILAVFSRSRFQLIRDSFNYCKSTSEIQLIWVHSPLKLLKSKIWIFWEGTHSSQTWVLLLEEVSHVSFYQYSLLFNHWVWSEFLRIFLFKTCFCDLSSTIIRTNTNRRNANMVVEHIFFSFCTHFHWSFF